VFHELGQTLLVLNDAPTPSAAGQPTDSKAGVAGQMDRAILPEISQLTRAIVAGDEAAFAQFYDLYSARLWRFLLVLTSGQEDMVRELHQVVMIKVARKLRGFTTDEALWAWLAQVARHAFIDYLRKQNRRLEHPFSESALNSLRVPDNQAEKHLTDWLDHALQHLNGEERALVESVYFEDRAHREVAAETGQTAKAVESRLARIRAKLRKFILTKLKHDRQET
jgi:RNA polymerase sigma-70 factor (ECF subfamily)